MANPTNPIRLFIDRQAEKIISYNGTAASIPNLGQNEVRDFTLQFGDPTGGIQVPYSIVNVSAYTCVLSIGPQPKGDGSAARVSFNPALSWDATNNWFYGQLDIRPCATALGSAAQLAQVIEIQLTFAGVAAITVQTPVNVIAVENQGAVIVPPVGDSLITLSQALSLFVPWKVPAGRAIEWQTTNPSLSLLESVDNNAKKIENVVPLS